MLNNELELVKSMTVTLGSFMEDPSIAAGRHKSGGGASEQSRDPDVWPPPTPQEPRYMYMYIKLVPSLVRNLSLPPKAGLVHERI